MGIKERIQKLCKESGVTMKSLEEMFGLGSGYLSKVDKTKPNTAKIKPIADYFNVSIDYLLYGTDDDDEHYYIDPEAREMAEFLHQSPEYRVLFDASRNVSKEDIEVVKQILDKFRK